MLQFSNIIKQHQTVAALIFFAILVAVFYGNTLGNDFVSDDTGQIRNNVYLRSLENLPKVFTSCIWESANRGCYGHSFFWRPMHFLSAMLTYQISSGPWIFHLLNLVYYFAVASLVFLLAKMLSRDFWIAFLAAVLFIIHPIHTEVVNFASAAPELLHSLFSLATVVYYVRYRQTQRLAALVFAYVFYSLAILSKEPAILVPVILAALDIMYFNLKLRVILRWREAKKYLVFGALFLAYYIARRLVLGVGEQYGDFSLLERMQAIVILFSRYIEKLFLPHPLMLYYPFEVSSFFSARFLIAVGIVVLFCAAFFFAFRRKQRFIVFALVWFIVFLSPVLLLLGGLGERMFAERYVFLPSVGFSFALAYGVVRAMRHSPLAKRAGLGALCIIILASWFVVFSRNREWKDNVTLFTASLAKNPDAHIIRRELGEIYFLQGDLEKARESHDYLIKNAPDWEDITMAYKGMGDYWRAKGEKEKTLEFYLKATETGFSPRDFVVYNDVGVIYMEQEQYLKGFSYFCQSLQLLPQDNPAQGNFEAALSVLDEKYIQEGVLRQKVLEQFTPSPVENIQYLDKRCQDKSCQFAFAINPSRVDVIPPFLITAEVEIINSDFDPTQNVIILETDEKYENTELTFLFPTCGRTYYEAIASQNPKSK